MHLRIGRNIKIEQSAGDATTVLDYAERIAGILEQADEARRLIQEAEKTRTSLKIVRGMLADMIAKAESSDLDEGLTVDDKHNLLSSWRESLVAIEAFDRSMSVNKVGDSSDEDASPRQRTTSVEECAAVADSDNPSELVRVALQHWDRIGWPEDAKPIALLERAIAILDGSTVITNGKVAL